MPVLAGRLVIIMCSDGSNGSVQPLTSQSVMDRNSSGSSASKYVTQPSKIAHSRKKKGYRSSNNSTVTSLTHPTSARVGIHQLTSQLSVVTESPPPSCSKRKPNNNSLTEKCENEEHEEVIFFAITRLRLSFSQVLAVRIQSLPVCWIPILVL